jgi:hypothetical protein
MFEFAPEAAVVGEAEVLADEAGAVGDAAEVVGEATGAEDVELDPEEHAASARQPAVAAAARSVLRGRVFTRAGLLKMD